MASRLPLYMGRLRFSFVLFLITLDLTKSIDGEDWSWSSR